MSWLRGRTRGESRRDDRWITATEFRVSRRLMRVVRDVRQPVIEKFDLRIETPKQMVSEGSEDFYPARFLQTAFVS